MRRLTCIAILASVFASAQDSMFLYSAVPGSIKKNVAERIFVNPQDGVSLVTSVQNPMLYVHRATNPNGTAVLICPGGGYFALAMDHEGHQLAKWFNMRGITAFVLKSRLPDDQLMTQKHIRPLQDAQQAMRIIRKNANRWGIDASRIGVMGFSAGGHLASTLGTHLEHVGEFPDTSISVRPDFMILIYPLISFQPDPAMPRLQNRLLGDSADRKIVDLYSNELRVTAQTPPTFLIHAADDFLPASHSLKFFQALRKYNVPAELHIYGQGGHGFSLTRKNRGHVENWDALMEGWLKDRKLL